MGGEARASLGSSTAERQRQELEVQYGQLEECGRRLNDVVAVHQCQFLEWISDRQEMLKLAVRCNLLDNELKEKNEVEKSLIRKLELLESQNSDSKAALENAHQNFEELSQRVTCATLHCQGVEEENQSLHSSVLELSARIDQLQAREQELLTKLKLRDETILEAADYITEFTSEFVKLEDALRGSMAEELSLKEEKKYLTLRLKELILERNKLKDDLCEQNKEKNKQQEEIMHLKRENVSLKNELALNVESFNRKDRLLRLVKSKQVQTDTEVSTLRQSFSNVSKHICMKQHHNLQFLHVCLESPQELRQKHQKEAHERSVGMAFPDSETDSVRTEDTHRMCEECGTAQVLKSEVRTTSEVCEVDNTLLLDASDIEKTISARLHQCQKVVKGLAVCVEEEKQDVASSSDELDSKLFNEANNTRPLRNREISENKEESRDQQSFESSSPEHWLNINYGAGLRNTSVQNTITPDKTGHGNKTWQERTGTQFGQKVKETPIATHKSECSAISNNCVNNEDARWEVISDSEWLKIFKSVRRNGSKGQRKKRDSFKTAEKMEIASSKRGSPCCLTSTRKGDRPQKSENFSGADSPLDTGNLSVTEPRNRCCNPTITEDACSPVRKLRCALAESQQMVPGLKLRNHHASSCCSSSSSSINTTAEFAEALHRVQLSASEEDAELTCFSL